MFLGILPFSGKFLKNLQKTLEIFLFLYNNLL